MNAAVPSVELLHALVMLEYFWGGGATVNENSNTYISYALLYKDNAAQPNPLVLECITELPLRRSVC